MPTTAERTRFCQTGRWEACVGYLAGVFTLVHERLARTASHRGAASQALTRREAEVLRVLATGVETTKTAAARLRVRPAVVRSHVGRVLAKLDAVAAATGRPLRQEERA